VCETVLVEALELNDLPLISVTAGSWNHDWTHLCDQCLASSLSKHCQDHHISAAIICKGTKPVLSNCCQLIGFPFGESGDINLFSFCFEYVRSCISYNWFDCMTIITTVQKFDFFFFFLTEASSAPILYLFWSKVQEENSSLILSNCLQFKRTDVYLNILWMKLIFSIIIPVFSVTWSFRNQSNMMIWCSRNIPYQCWKQLWCFVFLWKSLNRKFKRTTFICAH